MISGACRADVRLLPALRGSVLPIFSTLILLHDVTKIRFGETALKRAESGEGRLRTARVVRPRQGIHVAHRSAARPLRAESGPGRPLSVG